MTIFASEMESMVMPLWAWILFYVLVVVMLYVDLKSFGRKGQHEVSIREALTMTVVWITVSLVFCAGIYWLYPVDSHEKAMEFLAGYLIEKSLSMDNLFVFLMLFTFFGIPRKYQHEVLFWGIFGALVLRSVFIFAGAAMVQRFEWILAIFGIFLIYTGIKMFGHNEDEQVDPSKNIFVKVFKRFFPVTDQMHEDKFFVREYEGTVVRGRENGLSTDRNLVPPYPRTPAPPLLWVVDPLDGTTNFIHQYAPYAVSIALLQGREVLIGVVYEICADECFYAWKGGGAFVSRSEECGVRSEKCGVTSERLHVSSQKIQDALLCLQLPYNSDAYKPTIKRLIDTFYGNVGSIRMCGSAAMALCYVAAGRLDGYAEQYIGQWDYMAGSLIVVEAGGTVTDYSGSSDFTQGNSVISTNGIIQQDLLTVVKSA